MIVLSSIFWPMLPDPGLLVWTTIFFLLFWGLIGKYAFRPMATALKKRESDIQDALNEADKARQEMANLKSQNDQLMKEARTKEAKILKEANEMKASIIDDAKVKANEEANKIVSNAKVEAENQRMAALVSAKNQAGMIALDIAEKVIKKNLKGDESQEKFVDQLVSEIQLN